MAGSAGRMRLKARQSSSYSGGSPPEYDELCLAFRRILPALPAIDGFRIQDCLQEYDAIGQMRLDALELDHIEVSVSVENTLVRCVRWSLISRKRPPRRPTTTQSQNGGP